MTTELLPCPLCQSTNIQPGTCYVDNNSTREDAARCGDCGCRATKRAWQSRGQPQSPQAWCQPMDNGKHTPRTFIIYFEDRDRGIMVFDREDVARQAFEQLDTNWNCYLFGAMPDTRPVRTTGE